MPWLGQSVDEFRDRVERADTADYTTPFRIVQTVQGAICLITQIGYLVLVKRNKELHTRAFYLLAANAVTDLLFGGYIFLIVAVVPFLTGEVVPGGQAACQLYGAWTASTLVVSVGTLGLMSYERFRAICTPLSTLSDDDVLRLFKKMAAALTCVGLLPFAWGGFAVQPSGLYCEFVYKRQWRDGGGCN